MRLSKKYPLAALIALAVAGVAGVPAAGAAQNYAPECTASADVLSPADGEIGYKIICSDYNSTSVVDTLGDSNKGTWAAGSYVEADIVWYAPEKAWYKAATAVTSANEPSKPALDGESNPVIVWSRLSADTAASWAADSKAATSVAGVFPAGYVVKKTISTVVKYFKANAATTGSDVPGTSGKWDEITSADLSCIHNATATYPECDGTTPGTDIAYTGPQVGGNKSLTVSYPSLVNGYSFVALNRLINSFDTEPPVLTPLGDPAFGQVQGCNGGVPSKGIGCQMQGTASVYTRSAADTYATVSAADWYIRKVATGTGAASAFIDADYLKVGSLGMPINSGKRAIPVQSGNAMTGSVSVDSPCKWGSGPAFVATVADPEGNVSIPIDAQIESKYFTLDWSKGLNVDPAENYLPRGCTFKNATNSKIFYRSGGRILQVSRARAGTTPRTIEATGKPAEGYGSLG